MPERLVLCGGTKRTGGDSVLKLALSGLSRNITLKLEDISKKFVRDVPSLLTDLIEIASYVYCADQATSRGGEVQRGMGADWRRDFRFVIPVRNPDHWNNRHVVEALCSTLSFLSDDTYSFHFEKASKPVPFQNYLELGDDEEPGAFKADEVILFSGGLDSLSGTIRELSTLNKRVALVSHHSSSKIFDHQKTLVAALEKRFPKRIMHIPVLMTRQETLAAPEYTHRSRSFLYAAMACAVARLFGNTQIRFFENGVLSINLPIAEQIVGARATRTTHPLVLEHFREFFTAAISKPMEIDNPYIWSTKGDVIRSILDHESGHLIKHTVSCTRTYDITKLHTHCGCCSQCIDRRFAILSANATAYDPGEMYKVELFAGARDRANDQTMAEAYVRTALEVHKLGELAFFARFGGETARVCAGFPSLKADEVAKRVFDLHQRHAQAVRDALDSAVKSYSGQFISRTLPRSSLLMMTVSPSVVPVAAAITVRDSISEPKTEKSTPPETRKRGPKRHQFEKAKSAMQRDILQGRQTLVSLRTMLEKNLAPAYGVSRETARKARAAVLSEFATDK